MNPRFSDYVTSGAFSLTLTRNQIAGLGQLNADGAGYVHNAATLERKGLIEILPRPDRWQEDRTEFRLTRAGLLCLAMLGEAGLSNDRAADPVAGEFQAMRDELVALREEASAARQTARAAIARREEAETELENAQRRIRELRTGKHERLTLNFVRIRDPLPEISDAELKARAEEVS